MATKINQKEYLKKYLTNDVSSDKKTKKKKKKKPKTAETANVRIIDDDVDISRLRPIDDDALESYAIGEEAPQIVGVVDDRPAELIASEDYKQSEKWKVLRTVDGGFAVNQLGQDGMLSNREALVNDDVVTERRRFTRYQSSDDEEDTKRSTHRHLEKRKPSQAVTKNARPAGTSLAASHSRNQSKSPDRRRQKRSQSSDSDKSPVRRRGRLKSADPSPTRRRPKRKQSIDSDKSPPVRRRGRSKSPDRSPKRRRPDRKRSSDSDKSPVRRRGRTKSPEQSSKRGTKRNRSSDSDKSPPRRRNEAPPSTSKRRHDSARQPIKSEPIDSDHSPVRNRRNNNSDSDVSPPRRQHRQHETQPIAGGSRIKHEIKTEPAKRSSAKLSRWSRDRTLEPPPAVAKNDAKMMRTLDGKAAGLQNAQDVRKETDQRRHQEAATFSAMSAAVSGRDAEAVVRDRRTGAVRDVDAEMAVEHEKMRKELERKAVYDRWGKGVKQLEEHQQLRADEQHEASKPLARYADDADRDALLRERVRADDPMLEYVQGKQSAAEANRPQVPVYRGAYPDNRFGLRPGYRWDGVDRSNGFEKRWFEVQSRHKAAEEETYKYMTEDM